MIGPIRLSYLATNHNAHTNQVEELISRTRELYTHLNDVLVHATHHDDGSVTIDASEHKALLETIRGIRL